MIFHSDMHIHSFLSVCCHDERQTPENIVPLLTGKGYKKIGFADHLWVSEKVVPSSFYASQDGSKHLEMFDYIHSRNWDIEVLVGCEADMVAPDMFGITPEFKERLDYVVMSTNHFHMADFVQQPREKTPRALAEHMLEFFVSAAKSGLPDILVHPFFPYGYVEMYDQTIASLADSELFDAFSVAAENQIGIEINKCYLPNPCSDRCFDLETPLRILSLAKDAGCQFTLGSDSHSLETFVLQEKLQALGESIGLTADDIHPLARTGK
jgi:histidinol phosphatase-like PHP family hydrolase